MNDLLYKEILEILNSNITDHDKKIKILQYHENDIAEILELLEKEQRDILYKILGTENVAEVFSYIEDVEEFVEELHPEKAADIIEMMDADDAIDVLEELDEEIREEIFSLMDQEVIEDITLIAKYDEDMIGSKMTNNFISISYSDTIKSAMKKVVKEAAEHDNVSLIYVLNDDETIYGVLELRDLIIARENEELKSIVKQKYPSFLATLNINDCLTELMDYALDSYPIIDENNKLIGVITSDDIVEVIDEEMSDDYAKLAGLTEEESSSASILQSVKKRLPWLIILLILGLVQAFCMTNFERIVAALPVIVFFQTLILGMAGNTGTQSLAVTIRLLSDDIKGRKQLFKTIFKELRIGFLNGLFLALISFAIVFVFMLLTKQSVGSETFNYVDTIKTCSIISLSLLVAMSVSAFMGTFIPILFSKIKIDPAVASGPFITTINDVTALLIYYGLAALLFQTII